MCHSGRCGTLNSIFPNGALINIGTLERAYIDHRACVPFEKMRNSKWEVIP